ncbi:MAG: 2,4-dihydroxyhept-2-ene-1,7-dioic acid aldolase, partial [Actinobacteria bacterium]|nr:2,4-dihydroxyhept-2-ene-1,7-dioic acid aldolase [Actinomycetota bacterium]
MRPNRLRELLAAGKPSVGTHLLMIWPGVVELVGRAGGYDYIEFLAEYGPFDLFSLDNFGRTVELFDGLSSMIKLDQQPRSFLAQRAMGAGIQNLLFADVRAVDDVRECVRAVRSEDPKSGGIHGVAMRRSVGYVYEGSSRAYVQALDDAVVALMIEKDSAVRNLEQLLAVKGVDMVQFGPSDYGLSVGLIGERNHPKIKEAREYVNRTALAMGVQPRAEINTAEQAKPYLDQGVRH